MIFCLCALSFDCGVFDVDGSVLDTEAEGGGETTCDNTGNLDYRCAQRSRERQQLQKHRFLLG